MKKNKIESGRVSSELIDEITLFIQYGVSEKNRKIAVKTLRSYRDNPMALDVLKDYYSRLPELRDEAVSGISKIISRQGMYLIGVTTKNYEYLYFHNSDQACYLGERKDGIGEAEVLRFFGYSSNEDFLKHETTSSTLPVSSDEGKGGKAFCPACSIEEGEIHHLGCPVEICPWCEGQLSYCNCRFDKLGVDEIVSEAELDRFEIILNEKGRLPFHREDGPSYPEGGS